MKHKKIIATLMLALAITSNSTATMALTNNETVEMQFDTKSKDIKDTIEVEENGKKYILTLNKVVSEDEVKEAKEKKVEETKEYIVETNDKATILSQYPTIEYKDQDGSGVLNATDIVSIEVAGIDEKYYETLESITKELTLTAEQVATMGEDITKLTVDGKNYELTKADFTPSEFKDNEPITYIANAEYTTVIPHYEKSTNSYKVQVRYEGVVKYDEVKGHKTVANYVAREVEDKSSIVPVVAAATGTGAVLFVGWFLLNNVSLYSGSKKIKSYRRTSNGIEIDITKEQDLYDNLTLVISKRLSKRLDNTQLLVRANGKVVHSTVLNSRNEDIRISI